MAGLLYVAIILATFLFMEFVAWATHKYVMHGWLWYLHEDHHRGGYHPFQKNDIFFLIFAIPSFLSIALGGLYEAWWVVSIGVGIFIYGWCYFLIHDVVIHQRFKWFAKSNNRYVKVMRWAHKMHHKHLTKDNGESFGLLIVPIKYWKKIRLDEEHAVRHVTVKSPGA